MDAYPDLPFWSAELFQDGEFQAFARDVRQYHLEQTRIRKQAEVGVPVLLTQQAQAIAALSESVSDLTLKMNEMTHALQTAQVGGVGCLFCFFVFGWGHG
jgi:hypothetical protein